MVTYPFSSTNNLHLSFVEGLNKLISVVNSSNNINNFLLALSNSLINKSIYDQLINNLDTEFSEIIKDVASGNFNSNEISSDKFILEKVNKIGLRNINLVDEKIVGNWSVQFNEFRSFRPKRKSAEVIKILDKDFEENVFNYTMPSVIPEIFWQGEIAGLNCTFFYNKYPFKKYHLSVVPELNNKNKQFLTKKYHQFVWNLCKTLSVLPGIGIGYNSLGAFASVNHLHYQMYIDENRLPVTNGNWVHNGGTDEYPAQCFTFTTPDDSWKLIETFHNKNIPYNLLYTPEKLYCFPRKFQGTYIQPTWTSGFAWYEFSGGFITFTRDNYNNFNDNQASQELKNASIMFAE